jgi:hypothetical protein
MSPLGLSAMEEVRKAIRLGRVLEREGIVR